MDYNNPFTATFNVILNAFKRSSPIGELKEEDRIDGKTCLVTGANSGLGFAVATQLAQRGGRVFMACRSGIPEAGEMVKEKSGSSTVEMLQVDLSDLNSIESLCQRIGELDLKFDIVVCNAAVVPAGSRKTNQGFDEMFAVNYLAKFVLLNRLHEDGRFNLHATDPPRVIVVSSEAHRSASDIDLRKFGVFEPYKMSKVLSFYGYYKLVLNSFVTQLSRKWNPNESHQISVHALCPGVVNSNIAKEAPKVFKPLLKIIFGIFFQDPFKAARPLVFLGCSPAIRNRNNIYLHMWSEKEMDPRARDSDMGEKLWDKTAYLLSTVGHAGSLS